ncbi:MAG: SprB repeat-containing protein [Chitinophagales bacterium]|nr:SprB repeat-containing protein [Chitinophagales bacterium]
MKHLFASQFLKSKKNLIASPLLFFIVSHSFAQVLDVTFDLSSYAGGYHVACNGSTNGSIVATIVNGTSPYTYVWNTGATTQNLTNVGAGVYTLTVTDNASHTKTKTVTLLQSALMQITLGASNYNGYNVSRYGGTDGTVASNVTGGSPSYTYLWSNGATVSGLSNVAAGTYTVTVTDANGCTKQKTTTLTQPTAMAISSITSTLHNTYNVSCNGGSDGVINLTAIGGVAPYNYQWNNGSFSQNQTNLSAGTYTVVVRDVNNASISGSITLTQPTAISISATPSTYPNGYSVSCFQCFNGSIAATVTGGKSPYTYLWTGSQTTSTLSSLGGGAYTLTVTDLNSCTKQSTTTLTEPSSNDWSMSGNTAINANTTFIGTLDTSSIALRTNNTERLRIKNDGNVGIGTKTPQAKLQVAGNLIVDSLKFTSNASNEIHLLGTNSNGELRGVPKYVGLASCVQPVLAWYNNPCSDDGSVYLEPITSRVGIGTEIIPEDYKLAVKGKIICEEIKVKLYINWPDYIFDKSYKPISLFELENFIKVNKHLPGIPSAQEVSNNDGINLGELQTEMLKKLEELTLYIIELQKQVDALKK